MNHTCVTAMVKLVPEILIFAEKMVRDKGPWGATFRARKGISLLPLGKCTVMTKRRKKTQITQFFLFYCVFFKEIVVSTKASIA